MIEYRTIRLDVANGLATLTLARPSRLNALTREMVAELNAALDALPDLGARALLVTGEGRAFCSGADLIGDDGGPTISEDAGEILESLINPLMERLAAAPVPIVAAVNGPAAGAGCSLALAADFVVAANSAYFLLAFVNIGLVADAGATWRLPRLVGHARAAEMLMLGERVMAEQAADWGLIHRAVENEALTPAASALAMRLARGPTRAYGLIRQGLRAAQETTLSQSLALERANQKLAGESDDFREGVAAFAQRRQTIFQGR